LRRFLVFFALLASAAAAQQKPSSEADQAVQRLRPPKGLQASVFAAEPDFVNPVSFAFDEKGRAYVVETHRLGNCTFDIRGLMTWVDDDLACRSVADREAMHRKYMGKKYDALTSSERIRLLEDRDGDGRVDHAVTFAEGFNTPATGLAAGVLARKGEVWFACIPDLWHFKEVDGKAEERRVLHSGYGVRLAFIGHDLHGLRFGPDGKLYFTIGDRGVHVEKDGKILLDNPDSGCVMRCNPDGSGLELFATGLRNPQDLAFDAQGNLWTGDNNCDAGDAARWTYVMEGGDCGWRVGYQQAPGRGPWMSEKLWGLESAKTAPSQVPPVAHIGHGPAGICFNGGMGLPEAYKDHFFFTDFPGSVLSFAVKPKGAGFEVVGLKTFVGDVWPTDVKIGTDGALYFSDWVNGWSMPNKGRIYRVADPLLVKSDDVLKAKEIIAKGMADLSVDELKDLLGHPDQRIRQAAQFELAALKAIPTFKHALFRSDVPLARLHAIWGLGQTGMVESLVKVLKNPDAEERAQAARVLGDRRFTDAFPGLLALLKDPNPRVRSFAAIALGKLGQKDATGPLFEMLEENADKDAWLRHAGVMGLAGSGDATALAAMSRHPSAPVRLASLLALRRLGREEVAVYLEDQEPAIVFEAARAIHDAPIHGAMLKLAKMLDRKLPEMAWSRAIDAAYRTGEPALLGAFVLRTDVPEGAVVDALRALGEWANPSGRDRILHVWRPIPTRGPEAAREILSCGIDRLLETGSDAVKQAATTASGALGMRQAAPKIAALARKGNPLVRIAALKALAALKDESLTGAVTVAAADMDPNVRKEATKLLAQLKLPNSVALLEKAASEDGPVGARQNAIAALGQFPTPEADKALGNLMDALLSDKLPPTLRLDVLEASAQKKGLKEKVATYQSGWKKEDLLAGYRETLEGGDAESGRRIFRDKAEASCMKCHKLKGQGGEVGPALDGIGAQKSREYLLESLLLPNKDIAQGFAQVVLLLKSEAVESGRIETETETELALILADGSRKKIAVRDIQARKVGLSPMPEDLAKKLSKRDIRDLVEFLASLKER
jgi:quinoprotein glucose dehydrogenase